MEITGIGIATITITTTDAIEMIATEITDMTITAIEIGSPEFTIKPFTVPFMEITATGTGGTDSSKFQPTA